MGEAAAQLTQELGGLGEVVLITQENQLAGLGGEVLVAVPMSGAVQPLVLKACEGFERVVLFPAYVKGNSCDWLCQKMLELNAAPAIMDLVGVLKRSPKPMFFPASKDELAKVCKAVQGYYNVRGSKLLLIGESEPWVISVSRDHAVYKDRLGIEFVPVETAELICRYQLTSDEQARPLYDQWMAEAAGVQEPSEEDALKAARLGVALMDIIRGHEASGVAIACFNLLQQIGVTTCMAVSHINTHTPWIAACEGDTDAAVTMLLAKQIATGPLWMANPNLGCDKTVNFVHCTAPTRLGDVPLRTLLRNHHESGIGVSTQVDFPDRLPVTACRISRDATTMTIQMGTGQKQGYEPSCRTQYRVWFDDYDKYIATVLGCHQVFAFEEIAEDMRVLAGVFGLEVL